MNLTLLNYKYIPIMRKLKLQVQVSLDGCIAGPKGEMDWMVWNWDEELRAYIDGLTHSFDTIVLGRKLAQGFIPHWAGVAANPDNPEVASGRKFSDTPKVVFTKTLDKADWGNTVLAKGDLAQEITALKNQAGKDIIVYGGAHFVASLIQNNLIDDYHFFVNPVALGSGMAIFKQRTDFKLVQSTAFPCGIVAYHYQPANGSN